MSRTLNILSLTVTLDNGSTITYAPKRGVVQMVGWHADRILHTPVDIPVEQFLGLLGEIIKEKSGGS